jgi:hypothetical protein
VFKPGRPKGAKNKRTRAVEEAVSSGLTPLGYMLGVLRDEEETNERRSWAANAAAPYVHAKLANVDVGNKDGKPFVIESAATDGGLV